MSAYILSIFLSACWEINVITVLGETLELAVISVNLINNTRLERRDFNPPQVLQESLIHLLSGVSSSRFYLYEAESEGALHAAMEESYTLLTNLH